jgi:ribonuclease VapC
VKTYVLDSSALVAFFEDRAGAEKVEGLLANASEARRPLLMSVVNWGEVYYSIWLSRGEEAANEKLREISQLPIEVIDVDMPMVKLAARFKVECKLPYADCFAAALAQQRKSALVTSDHDFKAVEEHLNILWLQGA